MNFDDIPQDQLMESLRVPPSSFESETSVLGGLLMNNSAWDHVGDILIAEDFYRHEHNTIFKAIGQMIAAGLAADVVTVFDQLKSEGKADEVGGLVYLDKLAQYTPSASNMRRYAEIVREKSILRQLLKAGHDISEAVHKPSSATAKERVDEAVQAVQALQISKMTNEPVQIGDCMASFIEALEDKASGRVSPGIRTGFPDIDRMMSGGFKPGKVVCIAARPSVGKTALTLQILRNIAEDGNEVAFLSQEMLRDELSNRLVASAGRADYGEIESGNPSEETWGSVIDGVERLRNLPMHIDDQAGLTLFDIQSKARKLRSKHGIKVLAIDYLQLCQTNSKHDNRATAIGEISRGLKKLAMQLGITVVILSQLNRDVEKRTNGKPIMADLKESGDIEQDCDTIAMLSQVEDSEGGVITRCDIVKNRAGRKGELALIFQGKFQRWEQTVYDFGRAKKYSRGSDF
jgi:replicative DNA helicase